jgi:hypothetical protein
MISVAYNLPHRSVSEPEEQVCGSVQGECSEWTAEGSAGSEVIVFLSLITPIEEPDELAWIKWPMLGFGVAAFLLFKIFYPGTKFQTKTPTSRFGRGKQVGGLLRGQQQPAADLTAELRRELDHLEGM